MLFWAFNFQDTEVGQRRKCESKNLASDIYCIWGNHWDTWLDWTPKCNEENVWEWQQCCPIGLGVIYKGRENGSRARFKLIWFHVGEASIQLNIHLKQHFNFVEVMPCRESSSAGLSWARRARCRVKESTVSLSRDTFDLAVIADNENADCIVCTTARNFGLVEVCLPLVVRKWIDCAFVGVVFICSAGGWDWGTGGILSKHQSQAVGYWCKSSTVP